MRKEPATLQKILTASRLIANQKYSPMRKITPLSRIILLLSALAIIITYYVPLWQILLWAPQYPEGLSMQIWMDRLTGNIASINNMNHYIGMAPISEEMFPEFTYMKYIIGSVMAIGIIAALWGRIAGLVFYVAVLLLLGIGVLIDMYMWGYEYGHNLDPTAAIKVPDMTYQPPLIGYKQLLNFLAYSGPDTGGWILGGVSTTAILVLLY